jgi:hypothetical protein
VGPGIVSDDLTASKGTAVPAPERPGEAARTVRRIIVLPPIRLQAEPTEATAPHTNEHARAAAALAPGGSHGEERRKFTFRIDAPRHAAFAAAAERRGISRQRLLTEALDELLAKLGHANFSSTQGGPLDADGAATLLPEGVAALPPPL